jgi:phosphate transport system substrate-binding protein
MGYATPGVKALAIAPSDTAAAVAPTLSTTLDRTYPIARPLYVYTIGEPSGETKRYMDWILSPAGQAIVQAVGYVPLKRADGEAHP